MALINLTIEKVIIQNDDAELKKLTKKLESYMAKAQERFDQLMARLDTATNDIAADYAKLLAEVQAGTVSEASFAAHEANIAKLEALGASVDNPVPIEPEPPTV